MTKNQKARKTNEIRESWNQNFNNIATNFSMLKP